MKRIITFLMLLIATAGVANAQDTIVMRNGKELVVKVEKITSSELEYRNWGNTNGPLRSQNIADIFMVKYSDGNHEVFSEATQTKANASSNASPYQTQVGLRPLVRSGSSLVYRGTSTPLFDRDLQTILSPELYDKFESANRLIKTGTPFSAIGYTGLILGAIWYPIGLYVDDMEALLVVSMYCLGAASLFIPIGEIISGIGKGKLSRVAEAYNAEHDLASLRLGVTPALMRTADGIGAGLSFSMQF